MAARFSVVAAVLAAAPAAAAPIPSGAVVVLGDVDADAVLRAARDAGGAAWRLEALATPTAAAPPTDRVTGIEQLYVDADFDRCLAASLDPGADIGRLIVDGEATVAARAAVVVAACAHAATDLARAQDLLRRALVLELDLGPALAATRADFQRFADQVRAEVAALPRHRVEIASEPPGATIVVDGRPARCGPTACTATVIAGEHVVAASRFGRRQRLATIDAPLATRAVLALDPAPGPEARAQLAAALGAPADRRPPAAELGAVAADAFGTRVVVLVQASPRTATATLYDRATGKVHAIVEATGGRGPAAQATRQAIGEWRADLRNPIYRRPAFWIAVGTAAAGVAVAGYLILRREQHDLVFE